MAIRQPVPLNQFWRLTKDPGSGLYVRTATRWNNRVNGHNFDSENCMATIGAIGLDAHTDGRKTATPITIRNNQSDFSGGIGVDDVADAWRNEYNEALLVPDGFSYIDIRYQVGTARRFAIIGGDYDQVSFEEQCQKGGTFDHALGLQEYNPETDMFLTYDSLCANPHWIPGAQIRAFGDKLALRARGTRESWFVGLTKPRAALVVVTYRYGGEPKGRGRFALKGEHRVWTTPTSTGKPIEMRPSGTTIAVRQTSNRTMGGSKLWRGTADGKHWVPAAYLRYLGAINGTEQVK
jgi:hypothetical protein